MNGATRKIYTRRGDRGETRLLSGETVKKDDPRVKTYGSLDELQSHLGNLFPLTQDESIRAICFSLQDDIFVAGSELASTPGTLLKLRRRIVKKDVVKLETWIDELTAEYGLPDRFVMHDTRAALLREVGLSAESIAETVKAALSRST